MPFVGMEFVKCSACGREVRVWAARLRLPEQGKLTDDATIENEDGSFDCPFCRRHQERKE